TVRAAADAEAKKHEADGDAYAARTVAAAEAEAIEARAAALADGNQGLIDALPALVAEAAKGITGSNVTILNGADGINQLVASLVGQGFTIYDTLRHALPETARANGADAANAPAAT